MQGEKNKYTFIDTKNRKSLRSDVGGLCGTGSGLSGRRPRCGTGTGIGMGQEEDL